MSNLVSNPIVVTGSVTSYKSLVASTLGTLFTLEIQRLHWQNPGDSKTLVIGDPASGATLEQIESDSTGEDVDVLYIPTRLWRDFSIDVFPGGTLLIFTR